MWKISSGGVKEREEDTAQMMAWDIMKFYGVLDKQLAYIEDLNKANERSRKEAEKKAKSNQKRKKQPKGRSKRKY